MTTLLDAVVNLAVVEDQHPKEPLQRANASRQHYFSVGRSALLNILSALACRLSYGGGEAPVRSILDFGCAYGRVTRYLRAGFPDARLDVTDYNREGVAWCVSAFGASDVAGKVAEDRYDVILLGSVVTHLPEAVLTDLIPTLKRGLRKNGILMFTTQGAFSAFNLDCFARGEIDRKYMDYHLCKTAAAAVVADYRANGFGYQDYPGRTDYGCAVGSPAWYITRTTDRTTLLLLAQEQGWDAHQDVLAFLRVDDAMNLPRGRLFAEWKDPEATA